jgi:hypothetical protein
MTRVWCRCVRAKTHQIPGLLNQNERQLRIVGGDSVIQQLREAKWTRH